MPTFETNDGCELQYRDIGDGDPIVFIHGWSQSGAFFKNQFEDEELADNYRLIVPDLRGHGESSKPTYGYRLPRLAKDVEELVSDLGVDSADWVGWSMGCSVLWSYWDLFGGEQFDKLVLVDEPAWLLNHDGHELGMVTPEEALDFVNDVRNAREEFTAGFIDTMLSTDVPDEEREWMIQENLKPPTKQIADLAFIHLHLDWRDVIPRIDVPTLVVGAKESHVNWRSQVWIADELPNGELDLYDDRAHLLFYEEYERFNDRLIEFLQN
jgi:pimeloyl-ACP methyl ester carboxylesterase